MLFELSLFIAFFCFYCCLVPTTSTAKQDSFDNFIPSIKEAFSEEFDTTTDSMEEPTNPLAIACLPASKPRYTNQVAPISNPVLIVPFAVDQLSNLPTNPESLTYQELKEFVKVHNLQTTVKNICGKPYNRCKKKELIKVLKA